MAHTYEYPRPALTADCVLLGFEEQELSLLLIQRDRAPFAGRWALPGGFVDIDEDLAPAALRELREETGASGVALEPLGVFGAPGRDPRGRSVSVAYTALVRPSALPVRAADDARAVAWQPLRRLPRLAFDHDAIVTAARAHWRARARHTPVGGTCLAPRFALDELRTLCELLLWRALEPRRFRRLVVAARLVVPLAGRGPTRLLRFDRRRYAALAREGFDVAL